MKYLPHIMCVLEYTLVVDLLTSRIIGKARLVLGNSFVTVLYLGGNSTIGIICLYEGTLSLTVVRT